MNASLIFATSLISVHYVNVYGRNENLGLLLHELHEVGTQELLGPLGHQHVEQPIMCSRALHLDRRSLIGNRENRSSETCCNVLRKGFKGLMGVSKVSSSKQQPETKT